jgi:hypothetical protein
MSPHCSLLALAGYDRRRSHKTNTAPTTASNFRLRPESQVRIQTGKTRTRHASNSTAKAVANQRDLSERSGAQADNAGSLTEGHGAVDSRCSNSCESVGDQEPGWSIAH